MTKTIKDEVINVLENTRGVKELEFVSDHELKVVISNRNTDLISEVEKVYINLKINGLVNGYRENECGTEVYITINEQICDVYVLNIFTPCEKKYFGLDVLEYAFYKKELEGTDFETLMRDTSKPAVILCLINDIAKNSNNYSSFIKDFTIEIVLENILKTYYYENGTYDYFTLYQTDFVKKEYENENVDEYLNYADGVVTRLTNKNGEIEEKKHVNFVLVVLGIALAKVLRKNNMNIFEKFSEFI